MGLQDKLKEKTERFRQERKDLEEDTKSFEQGLRDVTANPMDTLKAVFSLHGRMDHGQRVGGIHYS
jgi:hypothetical protein